MWYNKHMEKRDNSATSNTEMMNNLRAENEALREKLAVNSRELATVSQELATVSEELSVKTQELTAKSQELAAALLQNDWLLDQLKLSKKKLFGKSSEQAGEAVMEQLSLVFNEAEAIDAKSIEEAPSETKVKAHTRKRRSGSIDDVIPEGLPVEVVEHKLPEAELNCAICGTQMVIIGKEVHRSLIVEPAKFHEQDDVYFTYACPECEKESDEANIVKTPKEPTVLPGSFASPEAIAHIMTQKFVMFSPLYRQEQEFERAGLKLSRQTMSNWVLHASDDWLLPIYEKLHEQLCREWVYGLAPCRRLRRLPQAAGKNPYSGLPRACSQEV